VPSGSSSAKRRTAWPVGNASTVTALLELLDSVGIGPHAAVGTRAHDQV
jgi:hypothetical protein